MPRRKRVVIGPILRVLRKEVSHEGGVVSNGPVDPICVGIVERLHRRFGSVLHPARTVLQHAKEIHVARRPGALATNLQLMRVPGGGPILCINIDGGEEEVVKQPDVSGDKGIQAMVDFELREKDLPLLAKSVSNVVPETLDASVVYAPAQRIERGEVYSRPDSVPAPYVGAPLNSAPLFNVCSDEHILGPVITADATGKPVLGDGGDEDIEDGLGTVIVASTNSGDEPGLAVDKSVYDNFETNKTLLQYGEQGLRGGSMDRRYRVDRRDARGSSRRQRCTGDDEWCEPQSVQECRGLEGKSWLCGLGVRGVRRP